MNEFQQPHVGQNNSHPCGSMRVSSRFEELSTSLVYHSQTCLCFTKHGGDVDLISLDRTHPLRVYRTRGGVQRNRTFAFRIAAASINYAEYPDLRARKIEIASSHVLCGGKVQ